MGPAASVLAIVTHYRYEQYLAQAIESLVAQTRAPDAIVVVDDGSDPPPMEIVGRFPQVTLLVTEENVGPYRLLQAVFDHADYDAFLLQDVDDWSTLDRLAILLDEAARTGARMVGCQLENIYQDIEPEPSFEYPRDANAAVMAAPTVHPVSMPASLIACDLIRELGGLATGLRFGADTEFIRRAVFVAKIANAAERCYFRRIHPLAATRRPDTGYRSALRTEELRRLHARARDNVARHLRGGAPNLERIAVLPPVTLTRVLGPELRWSGPGPTS